MWDESNEAYQEGAAGPSEISSMAANLIASVPINAGHQPSLEGSETRGRNIQTKSKTFMYTTCTCRPTVNIRSRVESFQVM